MHCKQTSLHFGKKCSKSFCKKIAFLGVTRILKENSKALFELFIGNIQRYLSTLLRTLYDERKAFATLLG